MNWRIILNPFHLFTSNNYTLSKHAHLMPSKKLTECPSNAQTHIFTSEVKCNRGSLYLRGLNKQQQIQLHVSKLTKTPFVTHDVTWDMKYKPRCSLYAW